jgi:DNA-binding PadR family transcriptional regulator
MDKLLSTRAALVQTLRRGPGYGIDLIRRVRRETSGQVRIGRGNVYLALRSLEREGLLRNWEVVPGGRRGSRARVYYELTAKGVAVAEAHRKAVAGLLASTATAKPVSLTLMVRRIRSCAEVSAFVLDLRDRMRKALA